MKRPNEVICTKCKGKVAMRTHRRGFLQQKVLGIFGIYPWKCGACGSVFLYRRRGYRVRPSEPVGSSGGGDRDGRGA